MMKKELSFKILEKIKSKAIKPKSRWEFILKNSALWLLAAFSLMIGSLATSVVVYMIDNNNWDLYDKVGNSFTAFFLAGLPYFWLVILFLFVILLYYNFKYTKSGYKYQTYLVILISVFLSLSLGLIFYNLGLAQAIDDIFAEKMPLYQKMINKRHGIFNNPEKGVLPGRLVEIIDENNLKIIDPENKEWLIIFEEIFMPTDFIKPGIRLIIVGQKVDENNFKADDIRPFMPRPRGWIRMPGMPKTPGDFNERKLPLLRINN